LCLGAKIIGKLVAAECLESFLKAEFDTTERHVRRVKKLG
jgi:ribose 5-phosphate isomerase RpiB